MAIKWKGSVNGSPQILRQAQTVTGLTLSPNSLAYYGSGGTITAGGDGTAVHLLYEGADSITTATTSADFTLLKEGDILEADYTSTATLSVGEFPDLAAATHADGQDTADGTDGKLRILEIDTTNAKFKCVFVQP